MEGGGLVLRGCEWARGGGSRTGQGEFKVTFTDDKVFLKGLKGGGFNWCSRRYKGNVKNFYWW